jgi:hypothetical protein
MSRRPGFIIVVILFVIVIVGFYIYLKKQQSPNIDAITAVPVNAALIAELNEPGKFMLNADEKSHFAKELLGFVSVAKVWNSILKMDSTLQTNPKLYNSLVKKELTLSMHEVGNKQYEWLYLTQLSGRYQANQLLKQIQALFKEPANLSESKYNQVKVFAYKSAGKAFYYAYHRGILMGSKSEILLQDAIRQVESETGIMQQHGFADLRKTAGNHADVNIFVSFEAWKNFYEKIISKSFLKEREINKIGDWVALDLNLKNKTLLLNGFANTPGDLASFYNLFKGQESQNLRFSKFVPTGTEAFCAFGISNLETYLAQLKKYMEAINQKERFRINQQQLTDVLGNAFDSDLTQIFQKEIALANFADGTSLFYIKTKGYNHAQELIQKWINQYAKATGTSASAMKSNYKIDDESVFPIYKFPIDYFPTRMFGPWFKSCKASYVTAFDDFIIFGESEHSLSRVIYNNVLQKTLAFDGAYTQYADFLSTKVNFYAFASLSASGSFLETALEPKAFDFFKQNQTIFRDFYGVSWQFAAENSMYYNNFSFRNQPSNKIKAATEWETRLDTTIAFKPQLVINHYSNEKEIFVQDLKNTIYLINKAGRIIWKKKLDEPILSEVNQVDYYKNGKLQYLFNTKSKIHLLDRNGNFVEHYPIQLPSDAVNALSIFDYDNRKNYRIFVPTADKEVYCYNIEGKRISGFKFGGADNKIIAPVQYVRDNNKDYILVTDVSRIYLLDRQGKQRLKLNKQFNSSFNNQFDYQPGNSVRKGRLVRTDESGTVYYIYFDGVVESSVISDFTPNHYFKVEDVTGDKVADLVFVDGKKLSVYSVAGKMEFDYNFSTEIKDEPSFYNFSSNQTGIGITESGSRKIFLFNGEGKFMEGFPLPGKTRFSIGVLESGSGRFNLIVGGDEQYLYNFKLN